MTTDDEVFQAALDAGRSGVDLFDESDGYAAACHTCTGTGRVPYGAADLNTMHASATCHACSGSGRRVTPTPVMSLADTARDLTARKVELARRSPDGGADDAYRSYADYDEAMADLNEEGFIVVQELARRAGTEGGNA